jgi:succinyl-CoA synthetase beta subunit
LAALAQAVARISALALAPGIAEAEINPLLVKSDGVVAVDALVVRKE